MNLKLLKDALIAFSELCFEELGLMSSQHIYSQSLVIVKPETLVARSEHQS